MLSVVAIVNRSQNWYERGASRHKAKAESVNV
jgi:hypothetical protein